MVPENKLKNHKFIGTMNIQYMLLRLLLHYKHGVLLTDN